MLQAFVTAGTVLQARLTSAAVDLSDAQQTEGVLSDHDPAADFAVEAAQVENTTAPRATRPGLIQSVIQKFQVRKSCSKHV